MEINAIKDAIREELDSCNDREKLLDALVKLIPDPPHSKNTMYAEEPETEDKSSSAVPKAHYDLLKEDWKLFKKGEIEAKPLEEVMAKLFEKYRS